MYPIPPGEHLVENRPCRQCSVSFPITDTDMAFYERVSPIFGGKKYLIPPPTLCPDCRQQRRLSFRNERKLYKRKCDATGKEIISMYSPDKPYKVFDEQYWKSDSVDNMTFGKDWKDQSFMTELGNLIKEVPKSAIYTGSGSENSEYNNFIGNMKDCYLVFDSMESRGCFYGTKVSYSTDCIDCLQVFESQGCYELIDGHNCYEVFFSKNCNNSKFLFFCENCTGCSNCINCSGLTNKEFYINNEKSTPEQFGIYKQSLELKYKHSGIGGKEAIYPENYNIQSTQCLGEYLENCSDTYYSFDAKNVKSVKYSTKIHGCEDIYDLDSWGDRSSLTYEGMAVGTKTHSVISGVCCWSSCSQVYYSLYMSGCSDCFGCVGLRNKSYCILNKQYTKEEYEEIVPNIVEKMMADGEWGEFFPASMSPFGYNETVAQEYFALEQKKALESGYNWSDYEAPLPQVDKTIPASKLPDTIDGIPDDILNWAIICEVSGRPFRIIKQELEFYRKHDLPIPRRHPDVRHRDRMALRNPRKLYERVCGNCTKDIISTYAPERSERVYCEECYNKNMY